jgi:hypothetical protein
MRVHVKTSLRTICYPPLFLHYASSIAVVAMFLARYSRPNVSHGWLRNAGSHVADTGRSRKSFPLTLDRLPRHWPIYHYVTNHCVTLLPITQRPLHKPGSPTAHRSRLCMSCDSVQTGCQAMSQQSLRHHHRRQDSDKARLRLLARHHVACENCGTVFAIAHEGPAQWKWTS